jgi:hypothetical protein
MCKTTDEIKSSTNRAAVQAASSEIDSMMKEKGALSEAECIKIRQEKMQVVNLLGRYLPGTMTSAALLDMVKTTLEQRGYNDDNTLFAQSVCPDEVNHEEGDVTDLFAKYWGEVFHMGGLAGLPFTGKTGFKAFSSHVPNDGHCFVLMAPHIGLDDDSNLGSYGRAGQDHSGTCCGAAVGALEYCMTCTEEPAPGNCPLDYQMQFILQQVYRARDTLLAVEDKNKQQAELVTHLHDVAHDMLDEIINVDFGHSNSTLVVLTGIQINMPRPFDDLFKPLSFYIVKKDGSREDLMDFLC